MIEIHLLISRPFSRGSRIKRGGREEGKEGSALPADAIITAGLAPPANDATMTLSINYIGSTTGTSASGLTLQNLSDPNVETTAWHHWFSVNIASFTPDAGQNQAFRQL